MRDAHRMKEKFDVTLDNRQIVSLLIAGIVVMGAVFVLGVVVGKKLASDAQTAAAPDLLSALDANAQTLQQVQKEQAEPALTFPDELTKKTGTESAAPAPKVAAKPAEAKPAPKPAEVKPEPKPEPKPEQAVAAAPKPAEVKPEPKPEPAAPVIDEDEKPVVAAAAPAPKKPEAKEKGKVESAAVPTRTATHEASLKDAIARASQAPSKPTGTVKGGAFTLQLSAFQSKTEADRFAGKLRDKGYAPFIISAEVPKKGTWYRVRMGSFATKDDAGRYLTDFKRETQLEAFVAGAE